MLPYLHTEYH
jgi:magnesium-transporting ATPase (P-type)